jgi:energy-coupling factor transport system permease protein
MKYNARAWIVWVVVIAILAMMARNPLYSIILLALSLTAVRFFSTQKSPFQSFFLPMTLTILLFSAIYHALFIHVGDHVLLELPRWPLVGGRITLEAMVDGARNGLVLITLIGAFFALNTIVPTRELIRLAPSSFQDLGVVVLIAITYIPETRQHLGRIREAQSIRGHRPRGLKDWRPLLIPLLVGGLERAMRLSEAMVARGHISSEVKQHGKTERFVILLGILMALTGWLLALVIGWPGYILLGAGGVALLWLIVQRGRSDRRTRYTADRWTAQDTILVVVSVFALVLVLMPIPLVSQPNTSYMPYPQLSFPPFDPLVGLALFLLSLPVIWGIRTLRQSDRSKQNDKDMTNLNREEIRQTR